VNRFSGYYRSVEAVEFCHSTTNSTASPFTLYSEQRHWGYLPFRDGRLGDGRHHPDRRERRLGRSRDRYDRHGDPRAEPASTSTFRVQSYGLSGGRLFPPDGQLHERSRALPDLRGRPAEHRCRRCGRWSVRPTTTRQRGSVPSVRQTPPNPVGTSRNRRYMTESDETSEGAPAVTRLQDRLLEVAPSGPAHSRRFWCFSSPCSYSEQPRKQRSRSSRGLSDGSSSTTAQRSG